MSDNTVQDHHDDEQFDFDIWGIDGPNDWDSVEEEPSKEESNIPKWAWKTLSEHGISFDCLEVREQLEQQITNGADFYCELHGDDFESGVYLAVGDIVMTHFEISAEVFWEVSWIGDESKLTVAKSKFKKPQKPFKKTPSALRRWKRTREARGQFNLEKARYFSEAKSLRLKAGKIRRQSRYCRWLREEGFSKFIQEKGKFDEELRKEVEATINEGELNDSLFYLEQTYELNYLGWIQQFHEEALDAQRASYGYKNNGLHEQRTTIHESFHSWDDFYEEESCYFDDEVRELEDAIDPSLVW